MHWYGILDNTIPNTTFLIYLTNITYISCQNYISMNIMNKPK